MSSDSEGWAFSIGFVLGSFLSVLVFAQQCGTPAVAIKECERRCANAGGVAYIYGDNDCKCADGGHHTVMSKELHDDQ